jgi:glutamine---fructose-6-phosphate transaminase (isomerizing)
MDNVMEKAKKEAPRWIAGIEPPKELLTATGTQILELECRQQTERLRELICTYREDSTIRAQLK